MKYTAKATAILTAACLTFSVCTFAGGVLSGCAPAGPDNKSGAVSAATDSKSGSVSAVSDSKSEPVSAASDSKSGSVSPASDSGSAPVSSTQKTPESVEIAPELTYPLTLKAGYSTSADDPRGTALQYMKEKIEKETDGNIILDIHPDGELGDDNELIAGLLSKDVDMTVSSAGNYAIYATRIGVSSMPFLFDDFESAWEFIDSDAMQDLCSELEPYNMHVLAFFDNGFRCVTTTDRPVNSVSDMKDLVIRTPENQIIMETMSELGATPKSYPFSDLKTALKSGRFDAQENPIPVIYNNGLYEVQNNLSVTNHCYDAMPLTIRLDLWEQLPAEYKDILSAAALEAQKMNRETVSEQTENYLSLLEEKGMLISYPDREKFKEATRGVLHMFSDVYGKELLEKI